MNLVEGLRSFNYNNVEHLLETLPAGTPDVEWLKYVGENHLVLITKDGRIRKNLLEKKALRDYRVVAFFLGGKTQSTKQIAMQIQNAWQNMEAMAKKQLKTGVAGAFMVYANGKTIKPISLPQEHF